jgi:hypothetical protein
LDKNPRKIQPQFSMAARLSGPHGRILAFGSKAIGGLEIEGKS